MDQSDMHLPCALPAAQLPPAPSLAWREVTSEAVSVGYQALTALFDRLYR